MKRIFFLLALMSLPTQAATYTACWDAVQNPYGSAMFYEVCIEPVVGVGECSVPTGASSSTSYSFTLPDTASTFIRVRAYTTYWDFTARKLVQVKSVYGNPIQIVAGITPPIIGCGCP